MSSAIKTSIAIRLIDASYAAQNRLIGFVSRLLFTPKADYRKILVFRTGSIGDNVCAIPAIVAIRRRYPRAEIHVLTNAGRANFVSLRQIIGAGIVDRIIDYLDTPKLELTKSLRSEHYDLFIELPQSLAKLKTQLRNMAVVRILGIRSAFGWEISASKFLRRYQEKYAAFTPETPRLLEIMERHGIASGKPDYAFNITDADVQHVEGLIARDHLEDANRNVALVVGAKRPQNRWGIGNFVRIAEYMVSRGKHVLIIGGPEDAELARALHHIPGVHDYTGLLTPMQSACLLTHCAFTVSNDTGPMHLSYAVGVPVIALFSSRDYPDRWFPPLDGNNVVLRNNNVHCSMCFSTFCGNNICMQGILPSVVEREIDKQIDDANRRYVQKRAALAG